MEINTTSHASARPGDGAAPRGAAGGDAAAAGYPASGRRRVAWWEASPSRGHLRCLIPPPGAAGIPQISLLPRPTRRLRTPWWDDAETNSHYHAVTTLNGRLAAYAWKRPWVRWVDCGDRFLAPGYVPADQAASATPDGDLMLAEPLGAPNARARQVKRNASSAAGPGGRRHLQPHLMYDLLHLTPEGYTRWAECLRPAIAEAFAWNANRTRRQ
mmetsp:Transcript_5896/g.19025  ORF Transcript_5896/g.19025 Transcript_5896/m.19025 type:complete len:214 (+) Transcript_5896:773-1414(+)